jgi:hypothetical protein
MAKWKGIVGQAFDMPAFESYINAVQMRSWRPLFAVVHNTSEPTMALYMNDWVHRPSWTEESWARNLASYYSGMGWSGGPHFFVLPTGRVLAFTPMWMPGTHSPAWNDRSLGIETVGEFETESFDGVIKATLLKVLAILHLKLGLVPEDYLIGVRGLHFHKEDPITTHKNCPGKNMVKSDLVQELVKEMQALNSGEHSEVPDNVSTAPSDGKTDDSNTSVEWLQEALNKSGANLVVDGNLGSATRNAVIAFQKTHNLTQDGIAGPLTRATLKGIAS